MHKQIYSPMNMLKEFHDKFDPSGKDRKLNKVDVELVDKRMALITEEFLEVDEILLSMTNGMVSGYEVSDYLPELAKELADLLYVVYGTAEELDIPLQEVFTEIHSNNMKKAENGIVRRRADGKIIKPDNWKQPYAEIKELLSRVGNR